MVDHRRADRAGAHPRPRRDVAVDATDLVRQASTVVAAPDLARADSLDLLETKDLLPGWYDDWVLFERARIEHVRFRALEAMALERLRAGCPNDAAVAARAALRIEPLHEGANLLLIQACLDSGGTVEAVRHFHDYRRRLEVGSASARPRRCTSSICPAAGPPRQRGTGR